MAVTTDFAVISLSDDTLRRSKFTANAAAAEVNWRFFDAFKDLAAGLTYSETESMVAWGRPLSTGELGCYSSHWSLWNEFINSDFDQLVVIEDDLILDWSFMKILSTVDFQKQNISYLRLFSRMLAPFRTIKNDYLDASRRLVRFLDYACGTQAYMLTKHGAGLLLNHCRKARRPIDHEMDRFWANGVPNLAVFPYPVIETVTPSRIGAKRFGDQPIPTELRARRWMIKASEKARRRLALISPNPRLVF